MLCGTGVYYALCQDEIRISLSADFFGWGEKRELVYRHKEMYNTHKVIEWKFIMKTMAKAFLFCFYMAIKKIEKSMID